jgi:CHAT domain-containing protein
MHVVFTDMDAADHLLKEHAGELTPELAQQADYLWKEAFGAGQPGVAQRAAMAAALIHVRLGMRREGLKSIFNLHQVDFMLAETVERYAYVREQFLGVYEKVLKLTLDDYKNGHGVENSQLAFQILTSAADCCYFSAELVRGSDREHWLKLVLQDLVTVAQYLEHADRASASFVKFVSLQSATLAEVGSIFWPRAEGAMVGELLTHLAVAAETWIPVDFTFHAENGTTDPVKTINTARNLAGLSARHGSKESARTRLEFAARLSEEAGELNSWLKIAAEYYELLLTVGESKAPLAKLRRAVRERIEEARLDIKSRVGRLWLAQELDLMFGEIVRAILKSDEKPAEIFGFVEALRARTLFDQMKSTAVDFPTTDLRREAAELERQILHFPPRDLDNMVSEEMALNSRLSIGVVWDETPHIQMLTSIEEFFEQHGAGFRGSQPVSSLAQIAKALLSDEALIEYCIPYRWNHPAMELWALVVSAKGVELIPLPLDLLPKSGMIASIMIDGKAPIDASPLHDFVTMTRVYIQRSEDTQALVSLQRLHELLIRPIMERGVLPKDFRRWIIVPDSTLHYIPFAALADEKGRHLNEEVALVTAPSASIWHLLQKRRPPRPASLLGFANPKLEYRADLPPLPQSEAELQQVCDVMQDAGCECEIYEREQATESRLESEAAGKHLLHFGTHGTFPGDDALDFHRLVLSPTAAHDGEVHAEEIRRLNLRAAQLVVLSICNGGLYRVGPGNEPYGLVSAFLTAGAQNVLATLWPIEDEVGRKFVVSFYKYLPAHGPAEALRKASQDFSSQGEPVRRWSAFTLIGAGRPAAGVAAATLANQSSPSTARRTPHKRARKTS